MGMLSRPVLLGLPLDAPVCFIFASLASSPGPGLGSGLPIGTFPDPPLFVIPSPSDAHTTCGTSSGLPHNYATSYSLPVCKQVLTYDARRDLREGSLEYIPGATGSVGIARTQFPMPEVSRHTLEAEQWVGRRPPSLDRIVSDPRFLLPAIESQHRRVDIEDKSRWERGLDDHPTKKLIVKCPHLWENDRCCMEQETAKCWLGITWKASKVLEYTVLTKQLCCFDAFESQDHGIEQCKECLANTVAVVPLGQAQLKCLGSFEADPRHKTVKQVHAAVMGKRFHSESDIEFSRSTRHCNQC